MRINFNRVISSIRINNKLTLNAFKTLSFKFENAMIEAKIELARINTKFQISTFLITIVTSNQQANYGYNNLLSIVELFVLEDV